MDKDPHILRKFLLDKSKNHHGKTNNKASNEFFTISVTDTHFQKSYKYKVEYVGITNLFMKI